MVAISFAYSCTTHFGTRKLADGWYNVADMENSIVENRPIVKASGFMDLSLDSCYISDYKWKVS